MKDKNGRNGKDEKGVGVVGVLAGIVAVVAVGVAGWFGWKKLRGNGYEEIETPDPDETTEPAEPSDPGEPVPETKPEPAPEPSPKTTTVPAKTSTPWNQTLLPDSDAVRGFFPGLNPRYTQVGPAFSAAQRKAAFKVFQRDWNAVAKAGGFSVAKLNASRLKVDGIPGTQTLRAGEWALSENWPQTLSDSGVV